jgi:hypothetical protein
MAIPFIFLMVAWKKKPPPSTASKWIISKWSLNYNNKHCILLFVEYYFT